ncbi:MAG: methionyl-tRNA formyltransferase [Phycisphaerae bacterium]|nr:methionyl-tRNA formyltransferase [Phycisphaerae bacterium]
MRIVFCGSGMLAVPALQVLQETEHELVAVLTQPPRPAGRGLKPRPTLLARQAEEMGLAAAPCLDINADDVVSSIGAAAPDVICVVDFGQIVRGPVRHCARLDTINLHASLLPALRGAAPVNWAIIRGHEKTGVTIFSLVDAVDAGPVLAQSATSIGPAETAEELKARLAGLGAKLLCRTLGLLAGSPPGRVEQDEAQATFAPLLKKSDGIIDWGADAQAVRNRIHGTWPWPGGQSVLERSGAVGLPVIIARAEVVDGEVQGPPGSVDGQLCVATGAGRVRILALKPAGKRLMAFKDFINGYRVKAGDRFVGSGA